MYLKVAGVFSLRGGAQRSGGRSDEHHPHQGKKKKKKQLPGKQKKGSLDNLKVTAQFA